MTESHADISRAREAGRAFGKTIAEAVSLMPRQIAGNFYIGLIGVVTKDAMNLPRNRFSQESIGKYAVFKHYNPHQMRTLVRGVRITSVDEDSQSITFQVVIGGGKGSKHTAEYNPEQEPHLFDTLKELKKDLRKK